MKTESIPRSPVPQGTIARVAIQCDCPNTGLTGSFLFVGESHRTKDSRVTPVYSDLAEMFPAIRNDWRQHENGIASGYIKL